MDVAHPFDTRHRLRAWGIMFLVAWGVACPIACGKPADVPEAGALLLTLYLRAASPSPDELRVSVYDDVGIVFKNARIPDEGLLGPVAVSGKGLGTVLIQPGVSQGQLRIHVRGLLSGSRILDAVARLPPDARIHGAFDLTLETGIPVDLDLDDVPDVIDDCPTAADPDQNGCPDGASPDASSERDTGAIDGGGGLSGDGDDGGPGSTGAVGGTSGTSGASGTSGTSGTGGRGGSSGGTGGRGSGGIGDSTGGRPGSGGSAGAGGARGGSGGAVSGGRGGGGMPVDAGTTDSVAADARPTDAQPTGKNQGVMCATSSECMSGFCADGVCCQSACDQPCQSCGLFGFCLPVKRMTDVPQCSGTNSCNPAGKCVAN